MRICDLTEQEVAQLREYGIAPVCGLRKHKHITFLSAIEGIQRDTHRLVDEGEPFGIVVKAVTEHTSNGYVWKGRKSAGAQVRQMVRLVQG